MIKTYEELLKDGVKILEENRRENAQFDAGELMGRTLGEDCRSGEYKSRLKAPVDLKLKNEFLGLCKRRGAGEPLQYLIGEWEFYGFTFKVGEGVLIPRQDTETLIETLKEKFGGKSSLTVTDLCAGSGCIGITLGKVLNTKDLYCVENSERAFGFLQENIKLNNSEIKAVLGDVLAEQTFGKIPQSDIIVCNPPYLTKEDMENLQTEVSFEPKEALYGGEDGLDFYRTLTRLWKDKLKTDGMLIYEIGAGQEDEVMQILVQHGFKNVRCRKDLCGVNRCVFGTLST